ncbi:MAG: hypothetical protein R3C44_13265 [Chloroflexota bacterium]
MRRLGLGIALIVIFLLTAAMTAVRYVGYQLAGLPFSPFDLYDWLVRSGAGLWLSLVEFLTAFFTGRGQNLATAATTTEWVLSLLLFFVIALIVGLIFYLFVGRRRVLPDGIDGITIGAVFGVPMLLVSLFAGQSLTAPILIIVWILALFLLWGIALSYSFRRLMRPIPTTAVPAQTDENGEMQPVDPDEAARLDRRHFLFQLGASTAAVTAVGATAGTLLAKNADTNRALRPFPVADAEFMARQGGLLDNFRRFAIVNYPPGKPEESQVVTLGAEYPDRNYVSVWLGEGSPIVVYENLETAMSAYRTDDSESAVLWLDK